MFVDFLGFARFTLVAFLVLFPCHVGEREGGGPEPFARNKSGCHRILYVCYVSMHLFLVSHGLGTSMAHPNCDHWPTPQQFKLSDGTEPNKRAGARTRSSQLLLLPRRHDTFISGLPSPIAILGHRVPVVKLLPSEPLPLLRPEQVELLLVPPTWVGPATSVRAVPLPPSTSEGHNPSGQAGRARPKADWNRPPNTLHEAFGDRRPTAPSPRA